MSYIISPSWKYFHNVNIFSCPEYQDITFNRILDFLRSLVWAIYSCNVSSPIPTKKVISKAPYGQEIHFYLRYMERHLILLSASGPCTLGKVPRHLNNETNPKQPKLFSDWAFNPRPSMNTWDCKHESLFDWAVNIINTYHK